MHMKIERIEKITNNMKDIDGKISANQLVERLNSMSFWELLSETSKIQIPIIQRDFAQGRETEKTNKIRSLFLKTIIEAVESEKGSLELDFVYGNVEKDVFQPLDGQQRLTTLFLLHWYIALKTGDLLNTKNHFFKFTYETRISSREFCNELVDNAEYLGEGKAISEKISDSKWFFSSWKKDPTIKAMLIMLDSIEERLKEKNDEELKIYWQKLVSENPPITFHFKQLNDIGLTDDLYIKMNARGKGLTDFENFKARFEKYIKENEFEKEFSLTEDNKEQWKELTEKTFSHKIDTTWTNLFWKHRGDDNQIDNEIVKFVAGIALNHYAQNLEIHRNYEDEQNTRKFLEEKKEKNITEEAVKRERIERRITILFNNPADVSPYDFSTKDSFEYLKSCFEVYSKNQNDELFLNNLSLWDFIESKKVKINCNTEIDNNLFIEFVKAAKTEYKQRVLFYAQTQYLLSQKEINSELFSEWLRVVRNIVQNSTIDSASAFIGAIGLIKELSNSCQDISNGCHDIYKYLSLNKIKSTFASAQTSEEIFKASIIEKNHENKQVIFSTEDANFFKGKIAFALYCVGVENKDDPFNASLLNSIYKVVLEHFNTNYLTNKFRSALLTIKNNDYYDYWGTWSYGTGSHKRCLIENTIDLKNNFTQGYFSEYLKEILLKLVEKSLDEIINEYKCPDDLPNWKCRLIKESQLLDAHCQAHYFGVLNDNSACLLFKWKKRPNSIDECVIIK